MRRLVDTVMEKLDMDARRALRQAGKAGGALPWCEGCADLVSLGLATIEQRVSVYRASVEYAVLTNDGRDLFVGEEQRGGICTVCRTRSSALKCSGCTELERHLSYYLATDEGEARVRRALATKHKKETT